MIHRRCDAGADSSIFEKKVRPSHMFRAFGQQLAGDNAAKEIA